MKFPFVAAFADSAPAILNSCAQILNMSLNRMKRSVGSADAKPGSPAPTAKIERPSTANIGGSVQPSPSAHKSGIPTYRSLSQPPSVSKVPDAEKTAAATEKPATDETSEELRTALLDGELLNDINLMTDEFKDCLDSVKLDIDSPSTTDIDTLNLGSETAAEILKNLKTPDELETPPVTGRAGAPRDKSPVLHQRAGARNSAPIKILSRKNSNSGIPVSMSMTGKTRKPSPPKQLPRKLPPTPATSSGSVLAPANKRHLSTTGSLEKTPNTGLMIKRNLDMFIAKKRRYETMRKDLQSKQKPMLELYNALMLLKKKLSESGEHVLDPMPPFELNADAKPKMQSVEVEVNDGTSSDVINVDIQILDDVKKSVDDIRANSVGLCKNLMDKRCELLAAFENIAKLEGNNTMMRELELHKNENTALETFLSETINEQEKELRNVVSKLTHLKTLPVPVQIVQAPSGEPAVDSRELDEMVKKIEEHLMRIRQLEKQLNQTQGELKAAQAESAAGQESGDALRGENDKLKQRITSLEKQMDAERRKSAHEVDRMKTTEMSSKTLKGKIKELETAKSQCDSRIAQLSADLRSTQTKLKTAEKNFEKELGELNKSRSLDKAVIERLNRDKSTFETRLTEATQQSDTLRADFAQQEGKLRQEASMALKDLEVQTNTIAQMRGECEKLRSELNMVQIQQQQSSELLRKKDEDRSSYTERECELQVEVVAQRAAIKALQEKVDASAKEKIRFIETIENINGSKNEMRQDIVKTIVEKEEEITKLHSLLKKREEDLGNKRAEVHNLKIKVENLQDHVHHMKHPDNENDLKKMIKEGRSKLEEALAKSLENEHKLIKFEHEMAQKIQTVAHLENTLKLRDGLIGVLKTKKEELTLENSSLSKYSEDIRNFVIEAKEELKEKQEIITQLELALNEKIRTIHKYEKRLHQMEEQLSLTNEKRYRLQDTVNAMERELEIVKTNVEHGGELRYDDCSDARAAGRLPSEGEEEVEEEQEDVDDEECECEDECMSVRRTEHECECAEYVGDAERAPPPMGLQPWQAASAILYRQYRNAYQQQQLQHQRPLVQTQSLGSVSERHSDNSVEELCFVTRVSSSGSHLLEDKMPAPAPPHIHAVAEQPSSPSCQPLHSCYAVPALQSRQFCYQEGDRSRSGCSNGSCASRSNPHTPRSHRGQHCGDQVRRRARFQWCANADDYPCHAGAAYYAPEMDAWLPAAAVQANHAIITRDMFARSCSQIKNHLEDSLRRLNETRANYS